MMMEEALKDLLALRGQSLDPVLLQNTVNKNPIFLFFSKAQNLSEFDIL